MLGFKLSGRKPIGFKPRCLQADFNYSVKYVAIVRKVKMKYQKSSHATYDARYHIVWITKYRNPVLTSKMQERLRFVLDHICKKI